MQVTTIDNYEPDPGELVIWDVDCSSSTPQPSAIAPSFNQSVHLAGSNDQTVWLAAAFTVPGRIDRAALGAAYHALINRHGTLHSAFDRTPDGITPGGITRASHDPTQLRVIPRSVAYETGHAAMRDLLWSQLDAACRPFGFPAFLLGAIDREAESTIICGFDHSHVDAYSISIVINDLHRLYHDGPEIGAGELPMCGDFVDFCAAESTAAQVSHADPRMREWLRFFDSHDNRLPSFPLDLGVAAGESARQRTDVREVLDDDEAERFTTFCRRNGASPFAGVVAAMGDAVRRAGGGPQMSLLFPMHTRRAERWRHAVGWFTTNAPLQVISTGDLIETVRRTGPALRRAVRLGEIPIPQVLAATGGFRQERSDIFMVSYIDYRGLPGAGRHDDIGAHHISNATTADDAQFWISRTDRGLALRTRYPDTADARRTMAAFLDDVTEKLRSATGRTVSPAVADDGLVAAP